MVISCFLTPFSFQEFQQRGEDDLVGNRPGNVGDDHTDILFTESDIVEGRAFNRVGESIINGGDGIRKRRHFSHFQNFDRIRKI